MTLVEAAALAERLRAELHRVVIGQHGPVSDVLTADRHDNVAEAAAVGVDQELAVGVLLRRHAVEHGGRGRVVLAQVGGVGRVDPAVLLLGGDCEGEDFALAEVVEATPS